MAKKPDPGKGPLTSTRSKARKAALELLFEAEQRGVNASDLLAERTANPTGDIPPRPYTVHLIEGVVSRWGLINELITTYARGWDLERMPSVDRAALRIGVAELLDTEVPDGVAISEAVTLVTSLSTDQSPAFVSGLLSRISEVKDTLG